MQRTIDCASFNKEVGEEKISGRDDGAIWGPGAVSFVKILTPIISSCHELNLNNL